MLSAHSRRAVPAGSKWKADAWKRENSHRGFAHEVSSSCDTLAHHQLLLLAPSSCWSNDKDRSILVVGTLVHTVIVDGCLCTTQGGISSQNDDARVNHVHDRRGAHGTHCRHETRHFGLAQKGGSMAGCGRKQQVLRGKLYSVSAGYCQCEQWRQDA